jgi:hypothetical protein
MQIRTLRETSVDAIEAALADLAAEGFAPTLAIVFASIAHDIDELRQRFAQAGLDVFGASSSGELLATSGSDLVVTRQSIVVMLFALDRGVYRVRLFDEVNGAPEVAGEQIGTWARETFAHPALVLMPAGIFFDAEPLVRGIERVAGTDIPIFGGKAGDDWTLRGPLVFDRARSSGAAIAVLCFDGDRISVRGLAVSGWRAVGVDRIVTKADGNVVHEIDGIPTQQLYREYLGAGVGTDIQYLELPLQLARERYSVLRAGVMPVPDSGAVVFAGPIPEGSRVRFSVPPGDHIVEESLEAMRSLNAQEPDAQALLLFSCVCRLFALGPLAEDEVRPIQGLWGVPLAGLYTYGQIGLNDIGVCDYLNDTLALVTLRER